MAVLDVQGIHKSFGEFRAVDNVSFQVEAGSICGFIGPNGAGKTTTMRIISTLLLPDIGEVWVNGHSVLSHPQDVRRCIGFMPDHVEMEADFSVSEMLDFYARAYGLKGAQRRKSIAEVVDFTRLNGLMDKQTTALSKGMKQRVVLATTMLHDPQLLILDEPAAGLDPRARIELRTLLQVLAEMGKAVLISSHILAELSEICDQVVVLEQGRLMGTKDIREEQAKNATQAIIFIQSLGDVEKLYETLIGYPKIKRSTIENDGVLVQLQGGNEERAELLSFLYAQKLPVYQFAAREQNLEDLFLSLTRGEVQ